MKKQNVSFFAASTDNFEKEKKMTEWVVYSLLNDKILERCE